MWYVHAGSFGVSEHGNLAGGCLDESGLVIKDIVADGCQNERPAKRIKMHARPSQLRDLIDASPRAWCTLIAIATVKAEVKRAQLHTSDPAWNIALAAFEPNPWRWEVVEGWASRAEVFFLWRWRDRTSATFSYELTCQQLYHLLTRNDVPPPVGLHLRDAALRASLEAYEKTQSRHILWPCRYLGVPIGGGKYQPDPSLWDSATALSKSQTIVFYEYLHITVGPQKKRHVVPIRVDDALNHHRSLPRWPSRSRNKWLNFSVEGLNAFAELKKTGISYLGVSYENVERPEFVPSSHS